jgi:hypothetical protein
LFFCFVLVGWGGVSFEGSVQVLHTIAHQVEH